LSVQADAPGAGVEIRSGGAAPDTELPLVRSDVQAYEIAITDDIQFNQLDVRWTFWLIGKDYDGYFDRKLQTPGNPHGCALIAPKYRVFVARGPKFTTRSRRRQTRMLASTI
jgi:hypothetical protein